MAHYSDNEILHDFSPRFIQYKDGRIQRLRGDETIPPSLDPTTSIQSKDVVIAPDINLCARLYLPKTSGATKLPLLLYFHGGAFVTYSAFSPLFHNYLNHLVSKSHVLAVSVSYRLAPENPLPAAFHDAWTALNWTASNSTDDWIIHHADLQNVYLAGDSAGGTIAHNTAVRFGTGEKIFGIKITGMYLNCPFFWGKDPIGIELKEEYAERKREVERRVEFIRPGMDEVWMNPEKDENVGGMGVRRVVVHVGGLDLYKDRGWRYKEVLEKSGWGGHVQVVEVPGEDHVFSVLNPVGENGMAMIDNVASFINSDSRAFGSRIIDYNG